MKLSGNVYMRQYDDMKLIHSISYVNFDETPKILDKSVQVLKNKINNNGSC